MRLTLIAILITMAGFGLQAQKINDSTTPLHLLAPAYDTPYGKPDEKAITVVLDRIYNYLNEVTPPVLINKETLAEVTDFAKIDANTIFKPGDFRLLSYE